MISYLSDVNTILKGGRGSGDFGHVGRAGKRGGSGGGGGKGKPRKGRRSREALNKEIESNKKRREDKERKKAEQLPLGLKLTDKAPSKGDYFITPNNRVMDISDYEGESNFHLGVVAENFKDKNFAKAFGLTDADVRQIESNPESGLDVAARKGNIRVSQTAGTTAIQTNDLGKKELRRLQKLYDQRKLNFKIGKDHFWENSNSSASVTFTFEEFLDAKFLTGSGQNVRLKESGTLLHVLKK